MEDNLFQKSDPGQFCFKADEFSSFVQQYAHDFSWAVRPEKDQWPRLIEFLSKGPILEIASGNGFWARLLAPTIPFVWTCCDDGSWKCQDCNKEPFFPIESLCACRAVEKYTSATTLVMIWPPPEGHSDPSIENHNCIIQAVQKFQGSQILYVGTSPHLKIPIPPNPLRFLKIADLEESLSEECAEDSFETIEPSFFIALIEKWDLIENLPIEKNILGDSCWLYTRKFQPIEKTIYTLDEIKEIIRLPQTTDEKLLVDIFQKMDLTSLDSGIKFDITTQKFS